MTVQIKQRIAKYYDVIIQIWHSFEGNMALLDSKNRL